MRIRIVSFVLLAAVALLGLEGCRKAAGGSRRQVILILLDAARADRFSCYGYARPTTPRMDRLAARGVVFHRHYAQGTGTRVSVPALLFSRYYSVPLFPDDPQVPYSSPENLFRRPDDEQVSFVKAFEAAGFTTAAISAHLWTGKDTPFAAEFQEMHDLTTQVVSHQYPYPRAWAVVDSAIEWIGEHRDEDFFLYLHFMDTHYPHYFEEDAQEFFGAPEYDARNFRDSGGPQVPSPQLTADDLRYIDALYDGSLRYADREIGRLIDFLADEELLEEAVVAITSDHGEHLLDGPGGRPRAGKTVFSHGGPWLEPVARIPFILAGGARLEAGEHHGFSEGVDVGPTLLALAGAGPPPGKTFDGVDLSRAVRGEAEPKRQASMHRSIRTEKYKCLFSNGDPRLLSQAAPEAASLEGRLFDLEADPGETKNLFGAERGVVAELLTRYREVMRAPYVRARAAVTDEQPMAAFAIAAVHFSTGEPLPRIEGQDVPIGWSLYPGAPQSALVAREATEPLTVRFRVPDGRYRIFLGMAGRAGVEVGEAAGELTSNGGMAPFGEIEVTGETFAATVTPPAGELLRVFYVGFVPPGASLRSEADDEWSRKLKALGYIE